ncbi:MBL fold metallo-hydrolase [Paenibacillus sp. R14(2021)]|uniref:MBL fold metallo-hydrolase n=1 Tax=Paenibacillus sp. R14(2021) TaxID=2859228 RepID=UPI001C611CE0|nr:MBL fold metallo-hydrolase [Paenibacillus sp. R14(2021)]
MTQASAGIQAIRVNMNVQGNSFIVFPALLWDDKDVILVDTGLPGQVEHIREAFLQAGIPFEKLTKIIITHQDMDHIGGLPELVRLFGDKVEVFAHEIGVPYLAGELPLVKSNKHAAPVKVDAVMQDGDILPYAGGIQVVFTPGHTPDHVSLYHIPSKTLITGDALTAQDGVLHSFVPAYTSDQRTALQSIAKLQALDIETAIAYHGGVCEGDLGSRLQAILDTAQDEPQ